MFEQTFYALIRFSNISKLLNKLIHSFLLNHSSIEIVYFTGLGWAILPQPWEIDSPWGPLRSWRLLTILAAVPSLLSGVCLFTLPESPKFLLAAGKPDEALRVLKKVYTTNTGESEQSYPVGYSEDTKRL